MRRRATIEASLDRRAKRVREARSRIASRPIASARRPGRLGVDPALAGFYAQDERRASSAERDLGLRWRDRWGSTYRAAWIADTGELYTVKHGDAGDRGRVMVIAVLELHELERGLDGWREVCDTDEPGTYEWLLDRAGVAFRGRPSQT